MKCPMNARLLSGALARLLLLAGFAALVSGCNTTRGIGEDVEAAGEAIEEAADEAEDELD